MKECVTMILFGEHSPQCSTTINKPRASLTPPSLSVGPSSYLECTTSTGGTRIDTMPHQYPFSIHRVR